LALSLNQKAALSLLALAILMGALIFAPAGDVRYWRGWLFLAVFVGASVLMTLDMAARDPALLARRMKGGPTAEKSPTQKFIMLVTSLGFLALLALPPFAYRHGWAPTSAAVAIFGDVLVALGLYGSGLVYRPGPTRSSAIRCMRAPSSTSSACRWRLAPGGGSRRWRSCFRSSFGGCSTRSDSSPPILTAIAPTWRRFGGGWRQGCSDRSR
jgi:hypothetical protein